MAIKNGYTSRQLALDIIMSNIRGNYGMVFHHQTLAGQDLNSTEAKAALRTLAKEHNRLLEKSKLDGTELEVPAE